MIHILAFIIFCCDVAYSDDSFSSGFIQGLRKTSGTTSGCYSSILQIDVEYQNFIEEEVKIRNTDALLHSFQTLTNQFATTLSVCNFEGLLNYILSLFETNEESEFTNLESFELNLLLNIGSLTAYYGEFNSATDPYTQGYYAGKNFSTTFQFYI